MDHRKRSKTPLVCFLLCIPLAFIAYFTYVYMTEELQTKEISRIEIISPDGTKTVCEDNNDISFYVNAIKTASKLSVPLREPLDSEAVIVNCDRGDKLLTYKIYPELSKTGCMFSSPENEYYLIKESSAEQMLSKPEFAFLYTESILPEMTVISGEMITEVFPTAYAWYYQKQNGEYTSYTSKQTQQGEFTCSVYSDRKNLISFARKPDDVTVSITDKNGKLLPEVDLDSLIFGNDTYMRVTVQARWEHKSTSSYYGEASYSFDLLYDVPAVLTVTESSVGLGGMVRIDVKYLNDNEKVVLSSDLKTNELYFSENNGIKSAFLAVDDSNSVGKYNIRYTIGDNEGSFELDVTGTNRSDRESSKNRLGISRELFIKTLGEGAKLKFSDILKEVKNSLGNVAYETKVFAPATRSGELVNGFGTRMVVNIDDTADTHLFYSIGDTYKTVDNSNVHAVAKGKVIYVGESETLGTVMIIDHGCGLCSWYYGLKKAERSVGTEVEADSVLGISGTNVYNGEQSLGVCFSVADVFVKPLGKR